MDLSEAPLHVRVAAALGCALREVRGRAAYPTIQGDVIGWGCGCDDHSHAAVERQGSDTGEIEEWPSTTEIKRYDLDWAAMGPEIERLRLVLWSRHRKGAACTHDQKMVAEGETYLVAACNLIRRLRAEGPLAA